MPWLLPLLNTFASIVIFGSLLAGLPLSRLGTNGGGGPPRAPLPLEPAPAPLSMGSGIGAERVDRGSGEGGEADGGDEGFHSVRFN